MPIINVLTDPGGIRKKETFVIKEGDKLFDWIIEKYGKDGFQVPTLVFKNPGNGVFTEIKLENHLEDGCVVSEDDIFTIVSRPGSGVEWFFYALITGASFFLASQYQMLEIPHATEQQLPNESPNNALTGQTNLVRPLQRIPDIYGKNRVWPDIILRSYFEYINHVKFLFEYLCIGRGHYEITNIKSGDVPIEEIGGTIYSVYPPSTRPIKLLNVIESGAVDGQELLGPNIGIMEQFSASFNSVSPNNFVSTDINFSEFAVLSSGDMFEIVGTGTVDGVYTFQSLQKDETLPAPATYTVTVLETVPNGTAHNGYISSETPTDNSVGPFSVPGKPDEIWIDLHAPLGFIIYDDNNSGDTYVQIADFAVSFQEVNDVGDPIGSPTTTNIRLTERMTDAAFWTFKFPLLVPVSSYEITINRISNQTKNNLNISTVKITRVAGVELITASDFGNVTTVLVQTRAINAAASYRKRDFNAVVTRKLATYDLTSQTVTTTISATSKMADAVLHILTDPHMGNKPLSQIDVKTLYEIQQSIDTEDYRLGRFCYTFSNASTPLQEELQVALNSARCLVYREGSMFRFVRDEIKPYRTALFNKRIKKPNAEKRSIIFSLPNSFDGVSFDWVDEITNDKQTIIFPENGSPLNPKKIDGAGIKNITQAYDRAFLEFNKMQKQRTEVTTTVLSAGMLVSIGDRVACSNSNIIGTQDGEIVGIDGLNVATSEFIYFGAFTSGTVLFRDSNGEVSSVRTAYPIPGNNYGFILDSLPEFPIIIRGDEDYQIGTLFNFSPNSNHDIDDFLVKGIEPSSDGYVTLKLINYDPSVYFTPP